MSFRHCVPFHWTTNLTDCNCWRVLLYKIDCVGDLICRFPCLVIFTSQGPWFPLSKRRTLCNQEIVKTPEKQIGYRRPHSEPYRSLNSRLSDCDITASMLIMMATTASCINGKPTGDIYRRLSSSLRPANTPNQWSWANVSSYLSRRWPPPAAASYMPALLTLL